MTLLNGEKAKFIAGLLTGELTLEISYATGKADVLLRLENDDEEITLEQYLEIKGKHCDLKDFASVAEQILQQEEALISEKETILLEQLNNKGFCFEIVGNQIRINTQDLQETYSASQLLSTIPQAIEETSRIKETDFQKHHLRKLDALALTAGNLQEHIQKIQKTIGAFVLEERLHFNHIGDGQRAISLAAGRIT